MPVETDPRRTAPGAGRIFTYPAGLDIPGTRPGDVVFTTSDDLIAKATALQSGWRRRRRLPWNHVAIFTGQHGETLEVTIAGVREGNVMEHYRQERVVVTALLSYRERERACARAWELRRAFEPEDTIGLALRTALRIPPTKTTLTSVQLVGEALWAGCALRDTPDNLTMRKLAHACGL